MIPRNENFSQSLSSSKHIILSVVTYKLYLQQQQKTTKKILNMKTRIQHVNSPSTSEENFLSQTSDQNTPHQGSSTIQYRNIKSESSSSIPCGTKRSSQILLDRCRCSCLFQACLYNKSYLPDFFPPLSTTLNSLLSSVINSSLLLYYGILLPLLMFPAPCDFSPSWSVHFSVCCISSHVHFPDFFSFKL